MRRLAKETARFHVGSANVDFLIVVRASPPIGDTCAECVFPDTPCQDQIAANYNRTFLRIAHHYDMWARERARRAD